MNIGGRIAGRPWVSLVLVRLLWVECANALVSKASFLFGIFFEVVVILPVSDFYVFSLLL